MAAAPRRRRACACRIYIQPYTVQAAQQTLDFRNLAPPSCLEMAKKIVRARNCHFDWYLLLVCILDLKTTFFTSACYVSWLVLCLLSPRSVVQIPPQTLFFCTFFAWHVHALLTSTTTMMAMNLMRHTLHLRIMSRTGPHATETHLGVRPCDGSTLSLSIA